MHDAFERFYVDLRAADARSAVVRQLAAHGLVTFGGVPDGCRLLELVRQVAQVRPHRDSDPSGVTVLAGSEQTPQMGGRGLGSGELVPHTDGAGLARPPLLVGLCCVQPSRRGGETVLVDGRAVHDELAVHAPAVLAGALPGPLRPAALEELCPSYRRRPFPAPGRRGSAHGGVDRPSPRPRSVPGAGRTMVRDDCRSARNYAEGLPRTAAHARPSGVRGPGGRLGRHP